MIVELLKTSLAQSSVSVAPNEHEAIIREGVHTRPLEHDWLSEDFTETRDRDPSRDRKIRLLCDLSRFHARKCTTPPMHGLRIEMNDPSG